MNDARMPRSLAMRAKARSADVSESSPPSVGGGLAHPASTATPMDMTVRCDNIRESRLKGSRGRRSIIDVFHASLMLPLARAAMMLAIAALPFASAAATKRHAHPAHRAAPPPATSADASDVPVIAAPAWLVVDTLSGQTLAAQNADAPRDPASLTKLMTAYVV